MNTITITRSSSANELRYAVRALTGVAADYARGEFKTLTLARMVAPGADWETLCALSERIGDEVLDASAWPTISPGVSVAEAAAASSAMVRAVAGVTYAGGGEISPSTLAEHARCWGV